jgi:hypothetical protein
MTDNIDAAGEFQHSQSLSSINPLQDIVKIIIGQFGSKVFIKIGEIQYLPIIIGPVALD